MAVSSGGASSNTIIIDIQITAQQADEMAKRLANDLLLLKDRQDILKASGRALGTEYKANAQAIQMLERQTKAYLTIANQQDGSLNQLRAKLSLATAQYDALSRAERDNGAAGKQLTTQIQQLQTEISKAEQATGRFQRNVGNYTQGIKAFGDGLQSYIARYISLAGAIELVKKTFDTALETDAVRTSLGYILESTELADAKLRELKATAEALGLSFLDTAKAYQMFTGAAKASNFDLQEADKVFNSVSRVLGVLHVPASGATRAFYALQEMISMGTVQSRQLNRMLGLVIPGSTKIMADALGVTVAQLHEMQRSGELITSEVLPKFAAQLDKAIAPGVDQIESLQAAVGRLGSAFENAVDENSGITKFFTHIINGFTQITKILTGTFNDISAGNWSALYARLTDNDAADTIVRLQQSYDNTVKSVNETKFDLSEFDRIKAVAKDANNAVEVFRKGIKNGVLTNGGKNNLEDYEKIASLANAQLTKMLLLYPELGKQVQKVVDLSDEQLTSIKQIRDRISELQKLPGSAIAGDDIFKRIKALQDRLKALRDNGNKEEENALKKIAEDRIKSELETANRLLTLRQQEYAKINADIDKRVRLYRKYNQDTTQLELERQYKISDLNRKFFAEDLVTIRANLNEATALRISLIIDSAERTFEQQQFQNEQQIQQTDRNITALAARIALGEQGLTAVIQSELDKRNALQQVGDQQRQAYAEQAQSRLQQIIQNGYDTQYQQDLDQLQRQSDLNQQRIKTNEQVTQSYADLVGTISDLTGKQTTIGKIAFLAQKAFAIQQIILNAELTKSEIILRYEILKRQAVLAATLAGPFAPFAAAAAVAALSIAQGAELSSVTASEVVQVGIVAATTIAGITGKAKGGVQDYKSDGKGGVLPGYAKKDDTNAYLRSGEAVVVSEAARDPNTRRLLSDINVAYGGNPYPGLALGGIYGGSSLQKTNIDIANQVYSQNQLNQAISRIKIYTAITDINTGQSNYAQIVENANF